MVLHRPIETAMFIIFSVRSALCHCRDGWTPNILIGEREQRRVDQDLGRLISGKPSALESVLF